MSGESDNDALSVPIVEGMLLRLLIQGTVCLLLAVLITFVTWYLDRRVGTRTTKSCGIRLDPKGFSTNDIHLLNCPCTTKMSHTKVTDAGALKVFGPKEILFAQEPLVRVTGSQGTAVSSNSQGTSGTAMSTKSQAISRTALKSEQQPLRVVCIAEYSDNSNVATASPSKACSLIHSAN